MARKMTLESAIRQAQEADQRVLEAEKIWLRQRKRRRLVGQRSMRSEPHESVSVLILLQELQLKGSGRMSQPISSEKCSIRL